MTACVSWRIAKVVSYVVRMKCAASGQLRTPPVRGPLYEGRDWTLVGPVKKRGRAAKIGDSVIPLRSASLMSRVKKANNITISSLVNLKDTPNSSVSALMRKLHVQQYRRVASYVLLEKPVITVVRQAIE